MFKHLAKIGAMTGTATLLLTGSVMPTSAHASQATTETDAFWRNATVYFLLTDRFANGDPSNDRAISQPHKTGLLRGFEGGDIRGVTLRINEGYFNKLGVDAIWTTPLIANVHGAVNESDTGATYAFHGYWPLDWSSIDPRLGTAADFEKMVRAAHGRGLRVIVDVIMNHSGPVTDAGDPRWPDSWVRPSESCDYKSFAEHTTCELSWTLQDIRTESEAPVDLPVFLIERWRAEGRLERETAELDAFFVRTGYPRAPKYYIVKWLTDWVRDYGVDGFRADTAKHVEPEIWAVLKREAEIALAEWRARNPKRLPGDLPFYMVGEVFNFGMSDFENSQGRFYNYGDRQADFYAHGFDALINMGFSTHLKQPLPETYAAYGRDLTEGGFAGRGILNYIGSHDDQKPTDPARQNIRANATRLMLSPGAVQIYYGDEIGRSLVVPGTRGDATLRSKFDWGAVKSKATLVDHWQRLGLFRKAHVAVGAGRHIELSRTPFVFGRVMPGDAKADRVVAAIGTQGGTVTLPVGNVFANGTRVRDAYSGKKAKVIDGNVTLRQGADVVLLERIKG